MQNHAFLPKIEALIKLLEERLEYISQNPAPVKNTLLYTSPQWLNEILSVVKDMRSAAVNNRLPPVPTSGEMSHLVFRECSAPNEPIPSLFAEVETLFNHMIALNNIKKQ